MDKRDKQVVFSLLFLAIVVLIVGIFINKINSNKDAIAFTPSGSHEKYENDNDIDDKETIENNEVDSNEYTDEENDEENIDKDIIDEENADTITFTPIEAELYSTINLNIRSGPGIEYNIVGSIPIGEKVNTTAKGSNGWYKLIVDGEIAYASGNFLSQSKPNE